MENTKNEKIRLEEAISSILLRPNIAEKYDHVFFVSTPSAKEEVVKMAEGWVKNDKVLSGALSIRATDPLTVAVINEVEEIRSHICAVMGVPKELL